MGITKVRFIFAKGELEACMYVTGGNGEFCADIYTADDIEDLATVRNALREHINAFLDLSCFYDGFPFQAEISACTKPSGERVELSVFSPIIQGENGKYEKRVAKEVLTRHRCFPFLTYALRDFRRAIQDPLDTNALVFRSIESIRNYFAEMEGLDNSKDSDRKKSWNILREKLEYEQGDFKFLQDRATARRHGQVIFSDAQELERCRAFAWQFLIRFIEHTFAADCVVPPKPNG